MDVREQVVKILGAHFNGDESIRRGDWSEATKQYAEATREMATLPPSEPFDRNGFAASCLAGTAAASVALGNHPIALRCAEEVLSFFDRVGNRYPAERGKWLLAILTKGIASAELGLTAEAEKCNYRAQRMLAESPANMNFRSEINQFVKILGDILRDNRMESKSWWQFWK